jgi:histidyl-tRNA synthetase
LPASFYCNRFKSSSRGKTFPWLYFFFQAFTFDQYALLKYIQNDEMMVRNDDAILASGITARVAEGGRYDDLVRMYRPPGSHYSSTPISVAVGVSFFWRS